MNLPVIKVEIIHIEGSLKGTIQEFYDPVITIGRHPDCHVCFPGNETIISRRHAEIRRDGNRFLVVDTSTNGTFVNGKSVQEIFLKTGDVLTISKDGPKISFLATILNKEEACSPAARPVSASFSDGNSFSKQEPPPQLDKIIPEAVVASPVQAEEKSTGTLPDQPLQKPFIVQFGAAIKSFDSMPITLGSSSDADFVIHHPSVLGHHLRIYMEGQNCVIKDLTGRNLVTINGKPAGDSALMPPDVCLALTGEGPFFQFLGDGRLAEIEIAAQSDGITSVEHGSGQ